MIKRRRLHTEGKVKKTKIPWVAYGNDELKERLGKDDKILCDKCGEEHGIILGTNPDTGKETDMIMAYKCGGVTYLCGVGGKIIPGVLKA